MIYPIIKVVTSDNLQLFGLYNKASGSDSDTVLLNVHGTASSFYMEEFEGPICNMLEPLGISSLFVNNRGHHVLETWQATGAAIEKFEDCLIDIDAWIEFALLHGHKKIILQGHSLGTEKVVYYMEKGKYRNMVYGVILLGFADSYGNQMKFLQSISKNNADLLSEAKEMVREGRGNEFIRSVWLSHAGVLPQSADSYMNFFSENSELSKALPLRMGKELNFYRNISVPILAVVGDKDPWTILPVPQAAKLMKEENRNAEIHTLENCSHSFEEKRTELSEIIARFIIDRLLHKRVASG